jgi:pyruvate dehydrogenase E1 component alpha subunit
MLWKLPVIFICENNEYAMGTSVERTSNVHDIVKLGLAYDMPSAQVNGMSPEDVHEAIELAVDRARKGDGPTFLEIKTYRYKGHSMSDPAKYRSKEEVEEYKSKDPIEQIRKLILEKNYATESQLDEIDNGIKLEVEESVKFAEESPFPDDDELLKDIYAQHDYPFITN